VRDEAGALAVEDLGSVNGVTAREHGPRATRLALAPGATFRVGHTTLRVAAADTAVTAALRDDGARSAARRFVGRRAPALVLTLAGAPLFGLQFYLGSTEPSGVAEFAMGSIGVLAAVLAWAGLWALATRIRSGQARFLAHLTVAWLVFAVAIVLMRAEDWYRFLAEDAWTVQVVNYATFLAAVTVTLYGHLAVASRLRRPARVAVGAAVTVLLTGLVLVSEAAEGPGHRDIALAMPLKPVPVRFIPAETPDAFLARAARLQAVVDDDAREAPDDDAPATATPAATPGPSARRTSRAP